LKTRLFTILLLLILLVGCGSETPATPTPQVKPSPVVGTGKGDIKIGLIGPLTGANAAYGTAMRRGVLMAIDELKTSGWLEGRKIVLIERNDQSSPDIARANFLDLVEKERVVALIGTVDDEVALAQVPLANQWQIPWVVPIASAQQITQHNPTGGNYIFRLAVPDVEEANFMVNFLQQQGYSRVALLVDNSKAGAEGRKLLTAALKTVSITPVTDVVYYSENKPEEQKAFANDLIAARPEIILYWGSAGTGGQLRNLLAEQNYYWPMLGPESLGLQSFGKSLPNIAQNIYLPQTFLADSVSDKQQDFVNRYRRQFNVDMLDFPGGVAQSYDGMHLLIEALKQPGASDNRDKLREALEKLDIYDGLIKAYRQPWKPGTSHEALSAQDLTMSYWKNSKLVKAETP
jgi:branched-chain amino acid transport system substrate-binding protein